MKRFRPVGPVLLALALLAGVAATSCSAVRFNAFAVDDYQVDNAEFMKVAQAIAIDDNLSAALGATGAPIRQVGQGKALDTAYLASIAGTWIKTLTEVNLARDRGVVTSDDELTSARDNIEKGISSDQKTGQPKPGVDGKASLASLGSLGDVLVEYVATRNKLADSVVVDDAEVRAIYDDNQAQFAQKCFSVITVDAAPAADLTDPAAAAAAAPPVPTQAQTDAAKSKADALVTQIRGGADFAALARDSSDNAASAAVGGSIGCGAASQWASQLPPEALALNEGEVTDAFAIQTGFAIIRFDSAGIQAFDEVKDQLTKQAQQQKLQTVLTDAYAAARITVDARYGTWDSATFDVVPPAGPSQPTVPTSSTTEPALPPELQPELQPAP